MRRLAWLALSCILLAWPARAAGAGAVIEGVVALPPAATAPPVPARYPLAASYTVGPPDPPAAVVWLEGAFSPPPPVRSEVAQRLYRFAPGLLPIPRGSVVSFPNLDDEYHSVFSYSKAKRFDLGRYYRDEAPAELTFDQPGVVKLFCEIHEHMRGTILVLDTPYFQKTDLAGRYRLEHRPPGHHLLKAWVDEDTVLERPVELSDGVTLARRPPGTMRPTLGVRPKLQLAMMGVVVGVNTSSPPSCSARSGGTSSSSATWPTGAGGSGAGTGTRGASTWRSATASSASCRRSSSTTSAGRRDVCSRASSWSPCS